MEYELIKFINNNLELEVKVSPDEETVWLSKDDMSILFNRDRSVITRHIDNVYKDGEFDKESTCAKNARMSQIRTRSYETELFNLDVVISVGHRVKSPNCAIFRQWAKDTLDRLNNRAVEPNIIVFNNNDISLDVKIMPDNDTVYLTKDQMSILFGRNRSVITRHINNIFLEGELDENRVCAKNARTGPDGKK